MEHYIPKSDKKYPPSKGKSIKLADQGSIPTDAIGIKLNHPRERRSPSK